VETKDYLTKESLSVIGNPLEAIKKVFDFEVF
jgi:hypothetical protein